MGGSLALGDDMIHARDKYEVRIRMQKLVPLLRLALKNVHAFGDTGTTLSLRTVIRAVKGNLDPCTVCSPQEIRSCSLYNHLRLFAGGEKERTKRLQACVSSTAVAEP